MWSQVKHTIRIHSLAVSINPIFFSTENPMKCFVCTSPNGCRSPPMLSCTPQLVQYTGQQLSEIGVRDSSTPSSKYTCISYKATLSTFFFVKLIFWQITLQTGQHYHSQRTTPMSTLPAAYTIRSIRVKQPSKMCQLPPGRVVTVTISMAAIWPALQSPYRLC